MPPGSTSDFIVVGAGTAGAIVASRLSENGRFSVLLVEAGGWDRNPWIHIPLGVGKTLRNERVNWCYTTEPVPELMGRRIYMARGKVVGGSGAVNGLVHVRGQPADFDAWRAAGCEGWGWSEVLPYFKRSEDHYLGDTALHAAGGPVSVRKPGHRSPLCDALVAAGVNFGLARNDDFNGERQDGVGLYDLTVKRGLRSNSAIGALAPARRRSNLRVTVRAHVERVLFEGGAAVGIEYRDRGGARTFARARREVVLCAGAIDTPKLLLLSGIGPRADLERLGIPVVAAREAVGANLQDHLGVRFICRTKAPFTLNDTLRSWPAKLRMGAEFLFLRRGPLTFASGQAGLFFKSRDEVDGVDAQAFLLPLSVPAAGQPPHPFSAFTVSVVQSRPVSRGRVTLRDADYRSAPAIHPGHLAAPEDREFFVHAVRRLREILGTEPLAGLIAEEYQPGPAVTTDAQILDFVRQQANPIYHPCGTCRMGGDEASVVDPQLRVRGVGALRIADASIMPRITSGNINATCLMIGEKAADLVLAETGLHPFAPAGLR